MWTDVEEHTQHVCLSLVPEYLSMYLLSRTAPHAALHPALTHLQVFKEAT